MLARNPPQPGPNVRGEDETELKHLINIIEALSWQLSPIPTKHPTVLLGRHPKSHTSSSSYIAAVYSMSKGGSKALEIGPEVGSSRKETLKKLLEVVEGEVGWAILRDGRRKGESGVAEGVRAAGTRGDGAVEGKGRGEVAGRMRLRDDLDQRDVGPRRDFAGLER